MRFLRILSVKSPRLCDKNECLDGKNALLNKKRNKCILIIDAVKNYCHFCDVMNEIYKTFGKEVKNMSKITEISHRSEGGLNILATIATCGLAAVTALEDEKHEVVVERGGVLGVGEGSSHSAARADAIRDLNK